MAEITLYQRARRDGGKRSGIEVGAETAYANFEEGSPDYDPTLVRYVDVRCSGAALPQDREGAREWLLEHADPIVRLVRRAAESVPVGYDPSEWPLQVSEDVAGARVTIAASAMRRVEARKLSGILTTFANRLPELIQSLTARPAA
jgi:hypothetical protein